MIYALHASIVPEAQRKLSPSFVTDMKSCDRNGNTICGEQYIRNPYEQAK
jgi:hypothetical protein